MIDIEKLKAYLKEHYNVYVKLDGRKRNLFYNPKQDAFGMILVGRRNVGMFFYSWDKIEKVYYPTEKTAHDTLHENARLIRKYKKLASLASFKNPFITDCLNADENLSPYDNHLSTGVKIEGKTIKLSTIEKYVGKHEVDLYRDALKNGKNYNSFRFNFQGYDGSLFVRTFDNGYIQAGFSKEYRNCGNGYYYLAINDDTFIGYDID